MLRRIGIVISIFIVILAVAVIKFGYRACDNSNEAIGRELDSYKGVKVYYNGVDYVKSYGKNFSSDGYYFGRKWQCVEYIKRFYYEAKGHKMPDVYGNARDFFDASLPQGALNKQRGLVQYINGGNVRPEPDDLLVFNDSTFGHVGIITDVGDDYVEIIQQNIQDCSRQKFMMSVEYGKYFVGEVRKPAGWLRKGF